jgi:hypothetical protein
MISPVMLMQKLLDDVAQNACDKQVFGGGMTVCNLIIVLFCYWIKRRTRG